MAILKTKTGCFAAASSWAPLCFAVVGFWESGGVALQGAWGMLLTGACRNLGAHVQAGRVNQAWGFPHAWCQELCGEESTRIVCWPVVLCLGNLEWTWISCVCVEG